MSPKKNAPDVLQMNPGEYFWCSCGESEKQPFCDGAHARKNTGKTPLKVKIDAPRRVAWCSCKESLNKPYCDGTHATL